jgi:hypothetical protein
MNRLATQTGQAFRTPPDPRRRPRRQQISSDLLRPTSLDPSSSFITPTLHIATPPRPSSLAGDIDPTLEEPREQRCSSKKLLSTAPLPVFRSTTLTRKKRRQLALQRCRFASRSPLWTRCSCPPRKVGRRGRLGAGVCWGPRGTLSAAGAGRAWVVARTDGEDVEVEELVRFWQRRVF